jgi:hypothetical protein
MKFWEEFLVYERVEIRLFRGCHNYKSICIANRFKTAKVCRGEYQFHFDEDLKYHVHCNPNENKTNAVLLTKNCTYEYCLVWISQTFC